jgi:molybdopterin-guanine dinucleotide biosynthesis protein A
MLAAGWILSGGASRRMGQDKALLDFGGQLLILAIAAVLARVSRPVSIIGPPDRYSHLGLPVIADLREACGPLAGIETALAASTQSRNLIVACDMPRLPAGLLERLLATESQCAVPQTPDGRVHPLCAVWDRALLPSVTAALDRGVRKVRDVLDTVETRYIPAEGLVNTNTPAEWEAATRG